MGRYTLVLVVLALLPINSAEMFLRPWENSTWVATNPSVWSYGTEIWWNIPELHNTINGMDTGAVTRLEMNGSVANQVSKAAEIVRKAEEDKKQCIARLTLSLDFFPATPAGSALNAFSTIPTCMDYRNAWIGSVDNSLMALEESILVADKTVAGARTSYDSLVFMGLCDSNYTHAGSESCAELQSAFTSVDNGIKEGKYGKYVLLKEYTDELNHGLSNYTPDLHTYPVMMGLIWDEEGVVPLFFALRQTSEKAKSDAETEYQSLLRSATARRSMAESRLGELRQERLELVDRAPASFSVRNTGTVAASADGLVKKEQQLVVAFEDAKTIHGRTITSGYLSAGINQIAGVEESYGALVNDISNLEKAAEETVGQQRDEAEEEIRRTQKQFDSSPPSSEASTLFQEAQEEYGSAERKGPLGERFSSYNQAAVLARSARNEHTQADETAAKSSLAALDSLIADAEKDGINIIVEKENFALLGSISPYDAGPYVRSMTDSIIAKAKVKYEDAILAARARIYRDLSLAGQGTADLRTDAERCDEGMFEGDSLSFPSAIGKLAKLKTCYATLLQQLDQYKCDMIGNSMSLSTPPHMGEVRLDTSTEITLDLVLANKAAYNCTSVNTRISLGSPWPFVYSDIGSGKEAVESVRSEDGGRTLVLVLKGVMPLETKRIILTKSVVLAHTLEEERQAEGLGDGIALVHETIAFQLDSAINRLVADSEGALIDGLPGDRPLAAGKHTLVIERTVHDAYSEKTTNIKAYALGTNSHVEYDVRILPSIDLDRVPVLLNSINDSAISSFDVASATGEAIKDEQRISGTQYRLTLAGLKKEREAVLKVSYNVEHTDSFVADEFQRLGSLNLSEDAELLLEQAKTQADSGNYTRALELIERSKAAQEEGEARLEKLRKEQEESRKLVSGELDGINLLLPQVGGSNSTFIGKLKARKTELERVLNGTDAEALKKIDMKWLGRELAAFTKETHTAYNDLKERFYLSGNTSTPQEFIDLESALNQLETGGRLEYVAGVLEALGNVTMLVQKQEKIREAAGGGMKDALAGVRTRVTKTLGQYVKQMAAAKGTEYSSLFQESEKKIETLLTDADAAAGKDEKAFKLKLDELDKSEKRMSLILDSLKNESEAKLSLLSGLLAGKPDGKKKDDLKSKLEGMRAMSASEDYINALRAGTAIAKEIDAGGWEQNNNGLLVLGMTAFAVLAAVGVYVVKGGKQEPKKLRRLQSLEKPPLGPPPKPGQPPDAE